MADGSVKSFTLSQGEGVAERIPWISASRRGRCTRFVLFTAANRRDDAMSASRRLPLERSQPTGDLVEILDPRGRHHNVSLRREAVIERNTRDRPLAAIATLVVLDARAFVRTRGVSVPGRQPTAARKLCHTIVGNTRGDDAGPRLTWVMPRKPARDPSPTTAPATRSRSIEPGGIPRGRDGGRAAIPLC
jgi:hypothetical protein